MKVLLALFTLSFVMQAHAMGIKPPREALKSYKKPATCVDYSGLYLSVDAPKVNPSGEKEYKLSKIEQVGCKQYSRMVISYFLKPNGSVITGYSGLNDVNLIDGVRHTKRTGNPYANEFRGSQSYFDQDKLVTVEQRLVYDKKASKWNDLDRNQTVLSFDGSGRLNLDYSSAEYSSLTIFARCASSDMNACVQDSKQ